MARSTGPAVAGVLISCFSAPIFLRQASRVFSCATVWTCADELARAISRGSAGSWRAELRPKSIVEGWKFSWRKVEVRSGFARCHHRGAVYDSFSTLLAGGTCRAICFTSAAPGQGLLLTAMGIGALCSSLVIASIGDRMPRGLAHGVGGVALYGVLVVIFSVSSWFSLSMALMAIIGICHVSSQYARANRDSNLFAA